MQSAALLAAGLPALYEAHKVPTEDLERHIRTLRDLAFRGFNVTIPHKETVSHYLDDIDAAASLIGAINTVVREDDVLKGYNTDATGFARAMRTLDVEPAGMKAVIFGAGGSARAVAHALLNCRADIAIVNRSRATAERLARSLPGACVALSPDQPDARDIICRADLLVNTTPLGMSHLSEGSPLPTGTALAHRQIVIDLVYGHPTPLLIQARSAGCKTMDGIEMLVQQGAESFRLWTQREPDIAVMRSACRRGIAEALQCSAS
jgi:shikimate dehydrogenase